MRYFGLISKSKRQIKDITKKQLKMNTFKMLLLGLSMVFTLGLQAQTEPVVKEAPVSVEEKAPAAEMRAQPKGERAQVRKEQRDALVAKLNLTEGQAQEFDAINEKYKEEARALRQNNSTDRKAVGQQMRELREAQSTEIKSILNEDQLIIYEAEMANLRESRRANRGRTKGKRK